MSSYDRYNSQSYAQSMPSLLEQPPYCTTSPPSPSNYQYATPYTQTSSTSAPPSSYSYGTSAHGHGYGHGSTNIGVAPSKYYHGSGYGYGQVSSFGYPPPPPSSSSSRYSSFPLGTHPDVIRSFQIVGKDRSGFIDGKELQQALSSGFSKFNLRTIHLLMFLFKHPNELQ